MSLSALSLNSSFNATPDAARREKRPLLYEERPLPSGKRPFELLVSLIDYGKAVPDLLFTSEISALLIPPSAFTSSRKFEAPTGCPLCDFVCPISAEFTDRSPFVSPINTGIGVESI